MEIDAFNEHGERRIPWWLSRSITLRMVHGTERAPGKVARVSWVVCRSVGPVAVAGRERLSGWRGAQREGGGQARAA